MKNIKVVIERSSDMYSAYAANVEGIYGGGDTPAEAKQSILDAIRLLKENNTPENTPAILKGEYEILYQFDVESLINYYKGIFTNRAFERLTGVNQTLIHQYSTGLKKPRAAQKKKIEEALHLLGQELLAVEL
jgi:predicted RNase H-like HicB family nuclease